MTEIEDQVALLHRKAEKLLVAVHRLGERIEVLENDRRERMRREEAREEAALAEMDRAAEALRDEDAPPAHGG